MMTHDQVSTGVAQRDARRKHKDRGRRRDGGRKGEIGRQKQREKGFKYSRKLVVC